MREQIKIKRIDNLVIVVTDSILQYNLPEGEEDVMFDKIEKLVIEINSGLLSFQKAEKKKEKLLTILTKKKRNRGEGTPLEIAYDLADGDISDTERKAIMKKIPTIHEQFEYDDEGYAYIKNHSVPLPLDLAHAMLDAFYNENSEYTVDSLFNFWQWALLNPNPEARNDLFGWFQTGNFTITESGQVVAYRCVAIKHKGKTDEFKKFIEDSYVKIKNWKKSPKNYAITEKNGNLDLVNIKTNPDIVNKKRFKAYLSEAYTALNEDESGDVYTDNHTKKMTIKIGEEVSMPRADCDEERENSCSRGLHFMSKKYNLRLGGQKLIVLINPMNIVAFPSYDNTKGRCCAYLPVAKAMEDENGDFKEFDNGTFDFEYALYTKEVLNQMINEKGLQQLQNEGLISKQLTSDDLDIMKLQFTEMIEERIVYVD